jgi:beta-N-acetylhexosaminidase
MNFAPVVDVDTNPANPIIGERSFSRLANVVGKLGAALIRGHQEGGVAACAKHFPGHGDTDLDSHLALPKLRHGPARLDAVELPPFQEAVNVGVSSVMTAHVIYECLDADLPATLSPRVLQPLLRERMGFEGVIISDDLEMKAVADHHSVEDMVKMGLAAGVDHFLCCRDVHRAGRAVEAALRLAEASRALAAQVAKSAARVRALKGNFLGSWAPPDVREARQVLRAPAHLRLVEQIKALQVAV